MPASRPCCARALVLTGGGARAAYQIGVLLAINRITGKSKRNPFPIICGTSAGAINAAGLACQAENFRQAVGTLNTFWRHMRTADIYRVDSAGVAAAGARWLSALTTGWLTGRAPRSLLDNTPLATLLKRHIDFSGITRAIDSGALQAINVTASGYDSGESINFFQAPPSVKPWQRSQRLGLRTTLGIEHLLGSSAIPFIFPAVRIHREYFGDGSMRQIAPLAPAIHLGADRLLVIGATRASEQRRRGEYGEGDYPSLAQIAGHTLSSIFLDGLSMDIERIQRVNRTLAALPEELRAARGVNLRPIETLVIAPSQSIDRIAAEHAASLPWTIRKLLGGLGAMNPQGGALTSYLLFEKNFTRHLIDLGYADTLAQSQAVGDFLEN
ncbi:patatin-like phospholipase family protein [Azonexus sp.]|uniref:patatin-like phospholipase family protein n=1 Tax=Azonexus sp. TaxID=1872668 RepID=UPI0039E4BC14